MANEVFANNAKISGDIQSKGSAKIGQGTVVIGNITATSAVIAGAVKGNVDINGPVVIDSSAVIVGDIKSKSVQINNGATISARWSRPSTSAGSCWRPCPATLWTAATPRRWISITNRRRRESVKNNPKAFSPWGRRCPRRGR